MNFEPGDILRWRIDDWFVETTVRELHYAADANANIIDGSVFTPSLATGEIAFRLSQSYMSYFPSIWVLRHALKSMIMPLQYNLMIASMSVPG